MIRIVQGALADQEASALVRAVRSDLAPVNTLSRDVGNAAGTALEERLEKLGEMPLGGAVITPAGALSADFLIHVVVMSGEEPQSALTVQRAVRNGLRRAADWELDSVAMPPLGIGVGNLEPDAAARVLLEILHNHLAEGQPPLDLAVVVGSAFEADLFGRLVDEVAREHSQE